MNNVKNINYTKFKTLTGIFLFIALALCFGCSSPYDSRTNHTECQILRESDFIRLIDVTSYADGGSYLYTFINGSGIVFSIFEDNSLDTRNRISERAYYIVNSYDGSKIELLHNTSLERDVLNVISTCERYDINMSKDAINISLNGLMDRLRNRYAVDSRGNSVYGNKSEDQISTEDNQ